MTPAVSQVNTERSTFDLPRINHFRKVSTLNATRRLLTKILLALSFGWM